MKTFRTELIANDHVIDYMEFETDTKEAALKYAQQRFENAYPFYKNIWMIKLEELNNMHFGGSNTQECNDCGSRLIEDEQCLTCDATDIKEI